MYSLRTHLFICLALLAALIVFAIIGNVLQGLGVMAPAGWPRTLMAGVYLLIFLAFVFSTIPVIVDLVLGVQAQIGNADMAVVASAMRQRKRIVWILWGLMAAGLLVAVPAALIGGVFGEGPRAAVSRLFKSANQ